MWAKFRSWLTAASTVAKLYALAPGALVAAVTGAIGAILDNVPLSVLIVLACTAFATVTGGTAFVCWLVDRKQDPPKLRRKRDLLGRFCASTYQMTEGYTGIPSTNAEALNEIRLVFAEDSEVQKQLSQLAEGGHEVRDLPSLIREMARSANMPVNHEAFVKPLVSRMQERAIAELLKLLSATNQPKEH